MLREAEKIAPEEFRTTKLHVLSGIGASDYYRSFGYHLDGVYMAKNLAINSVIVPLGRLSYDLVQIEG